MRAERNSLGGSFRDGRRSLAAGPGATRATPPTPLRESFARPLIPGGPAIALAMAPIRRRGAVA